MDMPTPPGGIPCCDRLCNACERLFQGCRPRNRECVKRPHHSLQQLQASAMSGCHLCNLILGVLDKEVLEESNEKIDVPTASDQTNLSVSVELGEHPRLELFGSRLAKQGHGSVSCGTLYLEDGDTYCLNQIFYIPSSKIDLFVPISQPRPDQIYVHRSRSAHTLHAGCLNLIRKWIQDCCKSHSLCSQSLSPDSQQLPRRLLGISRNDTGEVTVRVRQTEDLLHVPYYVTLSHRWKPRPVRLLFSNLSCFEISIPLDDLPKHFKEAIHLCWFLGYKYIWIDSLCIIQDSAEDWASEAARMCDIYANSSLTFAATAASESDCGLNCDRNYLGVAPCKIQASWENGERNNYVCYDTIGWQHHVEGPELHDRGWVVQERLLSRRTIHFAADQIYWECASLRASEFLPHGPIPEQPDYVAQENLKRLLRRSPQDTGEAASFDYVWTNILRIYTRTDLSHESDRIVAISGIVTALTEVFQLDRADFVMGLWKSRLPYQLLWYTEYLDLVSRPVMYNAPSWSWLSCGGGVEYEDIFWCGEPLISVLEVNGRFLYLQGFLCVMADLLELVKVDEQSLPVKRGVEPWKHELFKLIQWNDTRSKPAEEEFTDTLFFCPVSTVRDDWYDERQDRVDGLVLRPTGKGHGQYQRIGAVNLGYLGEMRYDCRISKSYSTGKLDQSLFLAFDETNGYTIVII